jgi:hypothetical protein
MENAKKLWYSKTFWTNLVALIGSVAVGGSYLTDAQTAELSVVILAVVNIALRIVTKDGVSLS